MNEEKYRRKLLDRSLPEPNTGCRLWLGALDGKGRGHLRIDKKDVSAHRLSYELFVGPIPDGLCVCHKCDVGHCIEPSHFFLGTKADNNRDCVAKKRDFHRFGVENGSAKIDDEEVVRLIRIRYRTEDITQSKLASELGISQQLVSAIVRREVWRRVA